MHQTPNGLYYDLWALPRPMTRTWGSGSLFKRLCENFGNVDMAFGKTDGIPEGVQYADLENGIDFTHHGYGRYHLVQFRVTGWDGWDGDKAVYCLPRAMISHRHTLSRLEHGITQMGEIVIGLDARDKFSCPVLLPEEVYSRLPEICSALEQKANQGG